MSAYALSIHPHLPPLVKKEGGSGNHVSSFLKPSTSVSQVLTYAPETPEATRYSRVLARDVKDNSTAFNLGKNPTRDVLTSPKKLDISVKSASIDPRILVGSYSRCGVHSSRRFTNKTVAFGSSTEDAVKFELSIDFNGRKYTATRDLPSFKKLRCDLLDELSRGKMNRNGLRRNHSFEKKSKFFKRYPDDNNWDDRDREMDTFDVIPELPGGISECDTTGKLLSNYNTVSNCNVSDVAGILLPTGTSGRGFAMFQAILRSYYCPAMECWIQRVSELVPPYNSPSFTQFLWEPIKGYVSLSETSIMDIKEKEEDFSLIKRKNSASLTLCNINEHVRLE